MHAGNYSLGDNFRPLKPLNHRYFFHPLGETPKNWIQKS